MNVEPCCWYCHHRHNCPNRCPNDPTSCQFCAWFLDEPPCPKFELDKEAYGKLGELLRRLSPG